MIQQISCLSVAEHLKDLRRLSRLVWMGRSPSDLTQEIAEKHEDSVDRLLKQVLPQDLVKFGIIPELVGRVPVTVSLEMLDQDALIPDSYRA